MRTSWNTNFHPRYVSRSNLSQSQFQARNHQSCHSTKIQTIMRQELIRSHSRRVLASDSSCSTESDSFCSSTISRLAHETKKSPTEPRRRVIFCETVIAYHPNNNRCKEDYSDCWYSPEDMRSFKTQTVNIARKILSSPTASQQEWIDTLVVAYEELAQATTAEDIRDILQNGSLVEIDPSLLGLEKWILRPVVHDKTTRRKRLYGFVHACNRETISSPAYRTKALRKASRELSRPSRLFAHHVAFVASNGEQWYRIKKPIYLVERNWKTNKLELYPTIKIP